MQHTHRQVVTALQSVRQRFCDRDTAMFASGAADGDGHIALSLPAVSVDDDVQEPMVGVQELSRARLTQNIVTNCRVLPRVWPQRIHPMRIGKEAHIHHRIRVHRQPVLVSERLHGDIGVRHSFAAEGPLDALPQCRH